MTLTKKEDSLFSEIYVGEVETCRGKKTVTCILDDNCVRYTVTLNGRRITRREYGNSERSKATCFKRATEALNN